MKMHSPKNKTVEEIRPKELMHSATEAYFKDVDFYKMHFNEFQIRACPGCGEKNSSDFCEKDSMNFDRCHSCLTIFMNPGPTSELVNRLYEQSENYKYWAESIYPATRDNRNELLHKPRASWIIRNLRNFSPGNSNRILEIGAGDGGTLKALHELDPSISLFGYEPNPDSASLIDANFINLLDGEFTTSDGEKHQFCAVTSFEVLEHTLNPASIFSLAHENLIAGGLFMCSTPNALSLEVGALKGVSTTIDIEHISLLTPAAILYLCNKHGFKLLEIETPGDFDVELISRSELLPFLGRMSGAEKIQLQSTLSSSQLSSHMKFVAIKNYE